MKKIKLIPSLIISALSVLPHISHAANITINIEGQGEILAQEANIKCTENCDITNDLSKNTLIASANSGWHFSGWADQKCDSGSQAIINQEYKSIGAASGGAKTLVTGDLNGDGIDDLVSISLFNGQVSTKINDGNASFNTSDIDIGLKYPTALDLYDWDGDNDLDIFVAEYGSGFIKMYLNDGNGSYSFEKNFSFNNAKPYSFAVADKNNDGLADFLISSFLSDISGDLYVLVNSIESAKTLWYINSDNQFIAQEQVSEHAAMTIDVHKENNEILIVSAEIENNEVALYRAGQRSVVDTGVGTYGAAFGDIDNDGLVDVLAAHYRPSKLNLVYGKGNAQFSSPQLIISPDEGVTATTFGDYNQDGYIDVATGEFNNKRFYYFPTVSYKDCIISSEADISVTAIFNQDTSSTTPAPAEKAKPSKSESSGGGLVYILFLLGLLTIKRENKLN